jgi:ferrochelatase
MTRRIAVVLLNLGGPDGQADVQGFLQNLFDDPAIIQAPAPVRFVLSRLISRTRAPSAARNYALMGGGSPLLAETRAQADALGPALAHLAPETQIRVFIGMRYWKPYVADAAREAASWKPDVTVLLPLYPQYSTTTTGSSLTAWRKAGGDASARLVCCYPTEPGFIAAHARTLVDTWESAGRPPNVRVLLSAHGLPERVITGGDPYQWQVEQSVAALKPLLPPEWETEICYQSRVGPLKWIGPPTDERIEAAAREGKAILLSPIAFVSEHIETLVELDIEYRELAEEAGAHVYLRAPALKVLPDFIGALARLVLDAADDAAPVRSHCGGRVCPADRSSCPNRRPMALVQRAAAPSASPDLISKAS